MFQRSIACETVGAVGPNAEHFLHATNLGWMSLWSQKSEPPQKGQGSGCPEKGTPVSPSALVGFRGMLLQSLLFVAIAGDNAKPPLFGANVHWSGSRQHFCALLGKLHISSGRAALEAFRRSQSDVHINGSVRELVVEHCSRGCAVEQEQAPLVSSGDQSYAEARLDVLEPIRTVYRVQFCIYLLRRRSRPFRRSSLDIVGINASPTLVTPCLNIGCLRERYLDGHQFRQKCPPDCTWIRASPVDGGLSAAWPSRGATER